MYIHSFRAHDRVSHVKCALHVDHVLCVVRATTHIIKQVLAWNRNPTRQEWSKHLNTFYRNLFSALTGWRLATFVAGLVVCCVVAELRQDDCGQRHDELAPPAQSLRPVHQANETLYHGRHRHRQRHVFCKNLTCCVHVVRWEAECSRLVLWMPLTVNPSIRLSGTVHSGRFIYRG